MRLIDANEVLKSCVDEKGNYLGHDAAVVGEAVSTAPTVDAVPVVRGRWVHSPDTGTTICTACGWIIEECFYDASTNKDYPFCPNCGADMREPNLDTTKGERRDESSG